MLRLISLITLCMLFDIRVAYAKTNNEIIEYVLEDEGGENTADLERPSKYGIGQYELNKYKKLTGRKVNRVTREEASNIYQILFIDSTRLNEVKDWKVRYVVMDWMVNSGIDTGVRIVKRLLKLECNSDIDDKFIDTLNSVKDVQKFVSEITERRWKYMQSTGKRRFLRGWKNRLNRILDRTS